MWTLGLLTVTSLCVSVTGHGVFPGRADLPMESTHPEICLPLATGLIRQVQPFSLSNFTDAEADTQLMLNSPHSRLVDPCRRFDRQVYRTIDGSCNTVANKGQSLRPLARLVPAAFSDGLSSPRNSSVLSPSIPLPSARLVSRVVHPDTMASSDLTIFVMQWGQLMDHEMVSTPLPIEDTRGTVQCCGSNAGPPTGTENSECFPILFPPDPDFRGTCMEFVRSQPVMDAGGNIIFPRENQNLITAFIDASTVYGSTQQKLDRLRDPINRHLLRTTPDGFHPNNGMDDCVKRNNNDICFLAGDDRVNELPGLTLLHTVLLRYHNKLASELRRLSPNAPGDVIFERARAVVWAVMQNILYNEWLPIILGSSVRKQFDLDFSFNTNYNPKEDPRIFQAFSTAVFRFGHTLIPRSLPLTPTRRPLLRELFFKPFETRENLDTLAAGLLDSTNVEDRSQPYDRFIVAEVTSHLFENQEGVRRGFDLVALNLQRSRDHAIPPYNTYRRALGLRPVTSFNDPLLGSAGPRMAQVYSHVDDIELFSGGIAEPPHDGGVVGETFSHLMGLQLHRLKFGDRLFYTHRRTWHGFTATQVKLIRSITLAHVLCSTTRIQYAQPNAFKISSLWNVQRPCREYLKEHPTMWHFQNYPLY